MSRPGLRTTRWRQLRTQILERDAYECQIKIRGRCLGTATEVDHIVPANVGGDDGVDNLRAACKPCNASGGAQARGGLFLQAPRTHRPPMNYLSPEGLSGPTRARWHTELPS